MKRKLITSLVLAVSFAVPCWKTAMAVDPIASPAAQKPAKENTGDNKSTVVRAYDVQDLLLIVKNYPLGGSLIPPTQFRETTPPVPVAGVAPPAADVPGAVVGAPKDETEQQLAGLKKLITDSVDPGSWKDAGGDAGQISSFNGQFFVTQTPENQTAIAAVLVELRKNRPHMIRIHADWVLLAPGQIDKLLKNGAADTSALPEVNRTALSALPDNTVHYTGQLACFSGQTVHIASGRAKNVVTNVTPVVAPSAVALDPTMAYMHYGISLEVTPTASTEAATLDLSSVISDGGGATPPPATQPSMQGVDRMNSVVQNFHTTVQVPLNKPVLIGGTTADPGAEQAGGKELYLIIEADAGK